MADAVLLPCFDGTAAPEWVRRRVAGSLGGVCLFARNVSDIDQVAALSASLAAERESVIIAIDEEAGDVTRLDAGNGSRFPGAAALGRVDDATLTRQIAGEAGALMADAGLSLNLAPCADVIVNPRNPVIGSRSFGPDPAAVARHTAAWITGQQAAGVAACAKHFPGHGDTDADTHRMLAVLDADRPRLDREALPPFTAAIEAGSAAIMPGHLLVPAVDDVPASVSSRWLTTILRGEMGFTGVIVTDALEMEAIAGPFGITGGAVRAVAAGADLLCIGGVTRPEEEIDGIRDALVDAVLDGSLAEQRLADAAARVEAVGLAAARQAAGPRTAGAPADERRESFEIPRASLAAATRALQTAGELPPLTEPVLIVRCTDTPNIAVGVIPWGPGTVLPGSVEITLTDGAAAGGPEPSLERLAAAGTVLVATRDRHRHPWMVEAVDRVRAARPDAVLVEMGISGVEGDAGPAIATFGATRANAAAAVGLLGGAARRP